MPATDINTAEGGIMVAQGCLFHCPKLPYVALFRLPDWLMRDFPTSSVVYKSTIFHFVKHSGDTGNSNDKRCGRLSVLSDGSVESIRERFLYLHEWVSHWNFNLYTVELRRNVRTNRGKNLWSSVQESRPWLCNCCCWARPRIVLAPTTHPSSWADNYRSLAVWSQQRYDHTAVLFCNGDDSVAQDKQMTSQR
jgi:hypothetical protein